MIFEGIILGALTWLSMIFSFMHLPQWIKRFMLKHFVLTDALSVILTLTFLSGISKSITSVIASIVCGLLVNITLMINRNVNEKPSQVATK